eukprot:gb/GECG01002558.1/.p1 GENE.gb/GECG01002558.1/~~gb/GECG01002558.1/.p1  ORF type:complete len:1012 (+),score=127.48 gb/GECG01002558.1/:1-3036(+)
MEDEQESYRGLSMPQESYTAIIQRVQKCAVNQWSLAMGITCVSMDTEEGNENEEEETESEYYCQLYARYLRKNNPKGMNDKGRQEFPVACEPPVPMSIGERPHSMSFNRVGDSLLIASRIGLAVVHLPKALRNESAFLENIHNEQFGKRAGQQMLERKTLSSVSFLGEDIYGDERNPILQAEWHPESETEIVVLSTDGIRCFSIHMDLERPTQVFLLRRKDMATPPVRFSLGCRRAWERMAIFILCENAEIFTICPYFPYDALLHLKELAVLASALEEMESRHQHLRSNFSKSREFLDLCFEYYEEFVEPDENDSSSWCRRVPAPSDSIFGLETEYPAFACVQGPLPVVPTLPQLAKGDYACDLKLVRSSVIAVPAMFVLFQSGRLLSLGCQTNLMIVPFWSFPDIGEDGFLRSDWVPFLAMDELMMEDTPPETTDYSQSNSLILFDASVYEDIGDARMLHRSVKENTSSSLCFSSFVWESAIQLPYLLEDFYRRDAFHIMYPTGSLYVEPEWVPWLDSQLDPEKPKQEMPEELLNAYHTLDYGMYGVPGAASLCDPRMSHQILVFQENDSKEYPVDFSLTPLLAPTLCGTSLDHAFDAANSANSHYEINKLQPFSEVLAQFSSLEISDQIIRMEDRDPMERLVLAADYLQRKVIPQLRAFKAHCEGREQFLEKSSERLQEHVYRLEKDLDSLNSDFEKKLQRMSWLHKRGKHLIHRISRIAMALSSRKHLSKKERAFYQQLKQIQEENGRYRNEISKLEKLIHKYKDELPVDATEIYGLSGAVSPREGPVRSNYTAPRLTEWEFNEIKLRLSRVRERESYGKDMIEQISNMLDRVVSNVAERDFEQYKRDEERQAEQAREKEQFFAKVDRANDQFHVSYLDGSIGTKSPTAGYGAEKPKPSRTPSRRKQIGIEQLRGKGVTARPPPSASSREKNNVATKSSESPARRSRPTSSPIWNVSSHGRPPLSATKFDKTPASKGRELKFETPNTRDVLQEDSEAEDNREEWGGAR